MVGITAQPPLALLQYDDGVAWDEGAANFTFSEDVAQQADLDEHGLDSEKYRPLGPGPRIEEVCEPDEHEWFPWPDVLWPNGLSEETRKQVPGHPRDFYSRIARCKQCGLSGDVAGEFGSYGSRGNHQTPWFCCGCGEAVPGHELQYKDDLPYCSGCATAEEEP